MQANTMTLASLPWMGACHGINILNISIFLKIYYYPLSEFASGQVRNSPLRVSGCMCNTLGWKNHAAILLLCSTQQKLRMLPCPTEESRMLEQFSLVMGRQARGAKTEK
jgi:hypothetical protein